MPKLYYFQAVKLLAQTFPCLAASFAAHCIFGLVVCVYYTLLFFLMMLFERLPLINVILFFVLGIGGPVWVYRLAKTYVLYLIKAGHIAVMAEILARGKLPDGRGQLEWGKLQVTERFRDVSIMVAIDATLRGVVATISRAAGGVVSIIPLPGLDGLARFMERVLRIAAEYVDEAILAQAFIKRENNVWKVAANGSVLYAQAWKPIMTNAVGLAVFSWASFVIFLVIFSPVGVALSYVMPESIIPTAGVIAMAYMSKVSIGDSFALAAMLVTYHEETHTLVADPTWEARLTEMSSGFRELKEKALEMASEMTGKSRAETAAGPETGGLTRV